MRSFRRVVRVFSARKRQSKPLSNCQIPLQVKPPFETAANASFIFRIVYIFGTYERFQLSYCLSYDIFRVKSIEFDFIPILAQ